MFINGEEFSCLRPMLAVNLSIHRYRSASNNAPQAEKGIKEEKKCSSSLLRRKLWHLWSVWMKYRPSVRALSRFGNDDREKPVKEVSSTTRRKLSVGSMSMPIIVSRADFVSYVSVESRESEKSQPLGGWDAPVIYSEAANCSIFAITESDVTARFCSHVYRLSSCHTCEGEKSLRLSSNEWKKRWEIDSKKFFLHLFFSIHAKPTATMRRVVRRRPAMSRLEYGSLLPFSNNSISRNIMSKFLRFFKKRSRGGQTIIECQNLYTVA